MGNAVSDPKPQSTVTAEDVVVLCCLASVNPSQRKLMVIMFMAKSRLKKIRDEYIFNLLELLIFEGENGKTAFSVTYFINTSSEMPPQLAEPVLFNCIKKDTKNYN